VDARVTAGPGQRLLRILGELSEGGATESPARLCGVCVSVTEMSGAGIMLMSAGASEGSLCATDAVSTRLDDLQYTLGEGPGLDAHRHARPILQPDLADPHGSRWIAFSAAAVDAGARAVFAFPLLVGAVGLGAITLYRDRPGRLGDDQHADALVMANVAAMAVLTTQAGAPLDVLADDLSTNASLNLVVHQAAGMTAIQLDVSVREALVRLRAFAFQSGRRLADVAGDVVARRLHLDSSDAGRGG
jgi:hypothetical protein